MKRMNCSSYGFDQWNHFANGLNAFLGLTDNLYDPVGALRSTVGEDLDTGAYFLKGKESEYYCSVISN